MWCFCVYLWCTYHECCHLFHRCYYRWLHPHIHQSFRAFPFNLRINIWVLFCNSPSQIKPSLVEKKMCVCVFFLSKSTKIRESSDHSFGHHSHSIFKRLTFITKPNSYHLTFVAQLMCEAGYFRTCGFSVIINVCTKCRYMIADSKNKQQQPIKSYKNLPDGWVFRSKWAFNSSNACGVNDVRRFRFFDGSTPIKSVKWLWPLL